MKDRPLQVEILRQRSEFLHQIRAFFYSRQYMEVETPVLSPYLIPEPAIEVFETSYHSPFAHTRHAYLVPSPELWMKRMLACGTGKIYQLSKCFRNSETLGKQHNPEFTMLEWYTPGHSYLDSIHVLEELLNWLNSHFGSFREVPTGLPLARLSLSEAFSHYLALDLDALHDIDALRKAVQGLGLESHADDSWEVLFNRLFLSRIEPELGGKEGVVLYDYPSRITTLAADCPDSRYAQRWELYLGGWEVANCYTEETDPRVIRERIESENQVKKGSQVVHPPDRELADWFEAPYPCCSGAALGVDRLFMYYMGLDSIRQALFFPFDAIFGIRD